MKRLFINFLVHLFMLVVHILFSCEPAEIKVSSNPDKLVLDGIFYSDSVMQISLTKNLAIDFNQVNFDIQIEDAEVLVYSKDERVDQLAYINPDENPEKYEDIGFASLYRSKSNFIPEVGKEYKIVINAKSFSEIIAYTQIPKKVEILKTDYTWQPVVVRVNKNYSDLGVPFSITFQDSPSTEDYYKIVCFRAADFDITTTANDEVTHESGKWLNDEGIMQKASLDHDITESYSPFQKKILISDKLFDGELYTLDFYLEFFSDEQTIPGLDIFDDHRKGYLKDSLFVTIQHITEAQYLYEITSDQQTLAFDDPFSEPVLIQSNVENGLGVFAGYSMTKSADITE